MKTKSNQYKMLWNKHTQHFNKFSFKRYKICKKKKHWCWTPGRDNTAFLYCKKKMHLISQFEEHVTVTQRYFLAFIKNEFLRHMKVFIGSHVLPMLTTTALVAAFLHAVYFSTQPTQFQLPSSNNHQPDNTFKHLIFSSSDCHIRLADDAEQWTERWWCEITCKSPKYKNLLVV